MTLRLWGLVGFWALVGLLVQASLPLPGTAQQSVPSDIVTIVRGGSTLLSQPARIERVSVGDPDVADYVAVSPTEVLVNARSLGTTTLIVWLASGDRRLYTVEVTADAAALSRQFSLLFPNERIEVRSSGNMLILSGRVGDPGVARRALEIARATGATVIDNLAIPPARQILLQVRFAEVTRRAVDRWGSALQIGESSVVLNPDMVRESGDRVIETLSDGLVRLFLFEGSMQVAAVIDALRQEGTFRSLAEPNLLAIEGAEASFLAGGEFPFPIPQGGQNNTVTIVFKEFGVRLRFTPHVTIAGNVRLQVMPEVSSLDFANGLQFSGFRVPALQVRRAETEVELRPGQTFAIAGLMDNMMQSTRGRIPILGDIPILGAFFRSRDAEQRRTELLVLVTPTILEATETAPPLPTGEPDEWGMSRFVRDAPRWPSRAQTVPVRAPVMVADTATTPNP